MPPRNILERQAMKSGITSGRRIGVGVIGASPVHAGWAVTAHVPAILALPDFELAAVATSRPETARVAGRTFRVPAFADHRELIDHPDVDLVVVAVKVPEHRPPIVDALQAGKMVFSEWPLGVDLAQASELTMRARVAGVRTFVGLQARFAPVVQHARALVASGAIGNVLATNLVGSGIAWGATTDRTHAYLFDAANGATTLTVPVLHALDALCFVLGEIATVSAASAVRQPMVRVADEGRDMPVNAPDQVAIAATLDSGVIASVFFRGGASRSDNLRWEINGSRGDLVMTAALGNLQVADLTLSAGLEKQATVEPLVLPPRYAGEPGGLSGDVGANVLRAYAAIAADLHRGSYVVPDFEHALRRHHLVAAIEAASVPEAAQPVYVPSIATRLPASSSPARSA
jgi:predicted dehydrogenase